MIGYKFLLRANKRVEYKLNFFIAKKLGWFFYPTGKLGKEIQNEAITRKIINSNNTNL